MAEILKINEKTVKIGTDDGKIITVPIACIAYPNPKEEDEVKVYEDGETYVIKKVASHESPKSAPAGTRKINKHVFVWVGNFLFGGFGVDRFLRGQIGVGICKLIFGWLTLGIWPLVDWIISMVKAYGDAYGNVEDISFDSRGHYTK